jgi:hypothetical protein
MDPGKASLTSPELDEAFLIASAPRLTMSKESSDLTLPAFSPSTRSDKAPHLPSHWVRGSLRLSFDMVPYCSLPLSLIGELTKRGRYRRESCLGPMDAGRRKNTSPAFGPGALLERSLYVSTTSRRRAERGRGSSSAEPARRECAWATSKIGQVPVSRLLVTRRTLSAE